MQFFIHYGMVFIRFKLNRNANCKFGISKFVDKYTNKGRGSNELQQVQSNNIKQINILDMYLRC